MKASLRTDSLGSYSRMQYFVNAYFKLRLKNGYAVNPKVEPWCETVKHFIGENGGIFLYVKK
ncbi:hypothetical protein SAMN04487969_12929 [Paenibacillus algorifonticola]|uniref:Uncharacterized protein n=1 Tax=Paenibacillus algorifonticola TaxID=684063 RepID=A0A1I2I088_9BACL|nr:hypothetical protein SAMN04487969_12929 [Paenibacillus algorifonticola]